MGKSNDSDSLKNLQIRHAILRMIEQATGRIGAPSLGVVLPEGLRISQAAIGRILMQFDRENLTVRSGYNGRRLTEKGRQHLDTLFQTILKAKRADAFLRSLDADTKGKLVQILVVRRALENEAARLAASSITDEELADLGLVLESQVSALRANENCSAQDLLFHSLIARASRNEVLFHSLNVLRYETYMSPYVSSIRHRIHGIVESDHVGILEALRARQPEEAARCMNQHINRIIDDIERYWQSHTSQAQTASPHESFDTTGTNQEGTAY